MLTMVLLQAYYFSISGVFIDDFSTNPMVAYNYFGNGPQNVRTMNGTRLYHLPYNATVQLVLQEIEMISLKNHPIHLYDFNF
ncbi:hypothetical protein GW17_00016512 [Ensete ventricosum]|nr:hypothetical protein GW17_00016512 [Ensete ventricosum]